MKRSLLLMSLIVSASLAAAQSHSITLEDIWANGTFQMKGIRAMHSMQDGEHYCTLTRSGIEKYAYRSGELVETICSFASANKARPLPPIEDYAFSDDEQLILLSANFEPIYRHSGVSDYYLYRRADGSFTKLTNEGKQRLTTLSPDGSKVAFVRDNNLYYMDLATLEEHAVTTDGKFNHIIYGTTDWVYEEEFAITQGFYWSPDSRRIAFYRFDESKVKEFSMQMWGELYPEDYSYKYPKAGEDNSRVDILIYDLQTGSSMTLNTGSERDQYLPRMKWTRDANTLAFMRMNRLQNDLEILLADASTGAIRTLYHESDAAYVEVPDTWMFLKDGKRLLLSSEREGYNQLYLYDLQGKLLRKVTKEGYDVVAVCGLNEKSGDLYFTAHASSPINRDFMKTNINVSEKKASVKRLGDKLGSYSVSFSEGCKYYLQVFSDANSPYVYTIHDAKGALLSTPQDNAQLRQRMQDYGTGRKQFGQLVTERGDTLNYYTILPPDFDSSRQYPLFFYVYGGPGNQQVNNAYAGNDYYWFHMLAEKGFVVACFDGRGTGGRGAAWKKMTYRDLGRMECEDAISAARWFGAKPWIDASRIGIFGWSFGGYLSTLSILKGHDVFKSAIAVAPVITWRYYDNIYTERFLQRPQDNPKGYDDNSPLNFANLLEGNYLLVHGTGDDNVHFQNAADMITALEKANKQFEMRIYPNKNHFINGGNTRLNLYTLMTDFIDRKF